MGVCVCVGGSYKTQFLKSSGLCNCRSQQLSTVAGRRSSALPMLPLSNKSGPFPPLSEPQALVGITCYGDSPYLALLKQTPTTSSKPSCLLDTSGKNAGLGLCPWSWAGRESMPVFWMTWPSGQTCLQQGWPAL